MMQSLKAVNSYRSLVRAARAAFRGDTEALFASRERIRTEYAKPVANAADFDKRLQMAHDVATILERNVVQGVRNEKGNYRLELRDNIELGDNDSRFKAKPFPKGEAPGCCGGGSAN